MCVEDHKPLFRQTGETNSETRFSLKFVNVGDERKFPKTSVCIILVDLVYLESSKIYTGSKIARGLQRLRTTALNKPTMQQRFHQSAKRLLYKYITPSFVGHSFQVKGESWYFFANSPLCIFI